MGEEVLKSFVESRRKERERKKEPLETAEKRALTTSCVQFA